MRATGPMTSEALAHPEGGLSVRPTRELDLPAVADIYGHHVLHGTASFELEPPGVEEMTRRWKDINEGGYTHLVAVSAGTVVGYAYASAYRPRPAYWFTVEDSIYIRTGSERRGIGRSLLGALIGECSIRGFHRMVAVIGDNSPASIALHVQAGFDLVGTLKSVGYKFGAWRDVTLMQRPLESRSDAANDL